ncbi:PREDICTED: zinc finger protein 511-like [Acropora digitifera]|uniref:zinc finger protein 511-like n=1 Tax=Acropora digitifera TaxID=70779 RepID=UPI00077A08FA|nr:PREDICTED: zinc finger protein 511-like [Acropora digitifera]
MEESVRTVPVWAYTPQKRSVSTSASFFQEGEFVCNIERKQLDNSEQVEDLIEKDEFQCDVPNCKEWFSSLLSYEAHYNSLHRHCCQNCQRSFPSTHLLEIHVLENHDTLFGMLASRKNLYRCLVESCPDRFSSDNERKDHLVSFHKYPADFRFNRPTRQQRKIRVSSCCEVEQMDTLPKTICFGRGSTKTFQSNFPKKNKKKSKGTQECEVKSTSDEVTMTDIS